MMKRVGKSDTLTSLQVPGSAGAVYLASEDLCTLPIKGGGLTIECSSYSDGGLSHV